MLNKLFLSLVCILTITFFASAQNDEDLSWRKHRKLAESLVEKGFFHDAAMNYEKAFKKNSDKKELIYLAAENYYKSKDFVKAAEAYKFVKDEKDKDFDLVGLKYAKSLKQSCDYESAIREFTYFENAYNGDQKGSIKDFVANEIKGCELALRYESDQPKINLVHLNDNINTSENELAPIAFADDILYFTSTLSGKRAMIYRSQNQNGVWSKYTPASGLPTISNAHLANGSFSPDGQRFYFTQCAIEQEKDKKSKKKDNQAALCEIFVIKKQDEGWSAPIRLRDYINLKGFTTTHPNVVHTEDKEILYFSSDREGGKGGMDLWYCVRDLKSNDIDFTFPKNLGSTINTNGDEITPFYNSEKGVLYFSSSGHIGIGGFDIFSSKGSQNIWESATNIGLPFNSCVDDYYYVEKKNNSGGFLVSNRLVSGEKNNTLNEDIFEFITATKAPDIFARGSLFDKKSLNLLKEVTISLYEMNNTDKQLLTTKVFSDGVFQIQVLPNKDYVIEADKDGYQTGSIKVSTNGKYDANNLGESIYLIPSTPLESKVVIAETKVDEPIIVEDKNPKTNNSNNKTPKKQIKDMPTETKNNVKNSKVTDPKPTSNEKVVVTDTKSSNKPKNEQTEPVTIKTNKLKEKVVENQEVVIEKKEEKTSNSNTDTEQNKSIILTSINENVSANNEGETYKVQIGAHANYQPGHKRYSNLEEFGILETDNTSHPGLTRVLIGNLSERTDAIILQRRLKMKGFSDAFIVTYKGGIRVSK